MLDGTYVTHDLHTWTQIAAALRLGWPTVPFSTGHQCRTAPMLADYIEAAVGEFEGDEDELLAIGLDWDSTLSVQQALSALPLQMSLAR